MVRKNLVHPIWLGAEKQAGRKQSAIIKMDVAGCGPVSAREAPSRVEDAKLIVSKAIHKHIAAASHKEKQQIHMTSGHPI